MICDLSGEWTLPQFGTGSGFVPEPFFSAGKDDGGPMDELIKALQEGDLSAVGRLLEERPELFTARSAQGASCLAMCVYMGQPDAAQLFLERGVQPNFFESILLGSLEDVRGFVEQGGIDVNAFAPDGFPPLGLAAFFGHNALVHYLLERGADPGLAARNDFRVTPLHAAAARGDAGVVRLLLERGADPNARQQGGFVALHTAAANGRREMAEILLAHGAEPSARNDAGAVPADLAERAGHDELAQLLKGCAPYLRAVPMMWGRPKEKCRSSTDTKPAP